MDAYPGYHATDPPSFADAIHTALTLSPAEELAIRRRARRAAVEKFSEKGFIRGWKASLGSRGYYQNASRQEKLSMVRNWKVVMPILLVVLVTKYWS